MSIAKSCNGASIPRCALLILVHVTVPEFGNGVKMSLYICSLFHMGLHFRCKLHPPSAVLCPRPKFLQPANPNRCTQSRYYKRHWSTKRARKGKRRLCCWSVWRSLVQFISILMILSFSSSPSPGELFQEPTAEVAICICICKLPIYSILYRFRVWGGLAQTSGQRLL